MFRRFLYHSGAPYIDDRDDRAIKSGVSQLKATDKYDLEATLQPSFLEKSLVRGSETNACYISRVTNREKRMRHGFINS